MYVLVHHTIHDVEAFEKAIIRYVPRMPRNVTVLQMFTAEGGDSATCVWWAESVEVLEQVIEESVGHCSSNVLVPIDEAKAVGLPKVDI